VIIPSGEVSPLIALDGLGFACDRTAVVVRVGLEAHGNQAMIRRQENVGVATYGLDRREREVFCTRIVVEQPTELDFPSETET